MGTKAIKVAPELQLEIEQFYYHEAELLDDHRYPEWLDLFSDDSRYWMPTRMNRLLREHDKEASAEGELALYPIPACKPDRAKPVSVWLFCLPATM